MQLEFRLLKCTVKGGEQKYRPSTLHNGLYETEQVLEEAIKYSGLSTSPEVCKSVVAAVLNSMISNTLKDGITRRFDNLFEIQLDVNGSFDAEDEPFDSKRHSVKVNIRALQGLKKKLKGVVPVNVKRRPVPHIGNITSTGAPGENKVKKGETIIIEGERLSASEKAQVAIFYMNGGNEPCSITCDANIVSAGGVERCEIPWPAGLDSIAPFYGERTIKVEWRYVPVWSETGAWRTVQYSHKVEIVE